MISWSIYFDAFSFRLTLQPNPKVGVRNFLLLINQIECNIIKADLTLSYLVVTQFYDFWFDNFQGNIKYNWSQINKVIYQMIG